MNDTKTTVFDVRNIFNIPFRDNYTPDFSRKQVRDRVSKVLSSIYYTFGPNSKNSKMITQKYLFKTIGNTSRGLGAYLKNSLYKCTDEYFSKDDRIAKKYSINWEAFNIFAKKVFPEDSMFIIEDKLLKSAIDIATEKFQSEIEQLKSGNLSYHIKSNRFYTSIQHVPKEIKQKMLANEGFQYQYDTECAAASLLYRHAKKLGFKGKLDSIFNYVENKTIIRNELAAKTHLDIKTVKMIITALFSGGVLARNTHSSLYRAILEDTSSEYDADSITLMINTDPFIVELKKNISDMWKFLKVEDDILKKKVSLKIGKRSMRLTASDKWSLYFKLEQRVLIAIIAYTHARDISALFEHDGFTTNKKIDLKDLTKFILEKTGYEIKMSYDFIPSLVTNVISDKTVNDNHSIVNTIDSSLFDSLFNGFKTKNGDLLKLLVNDKNLDQDDIDFINDCFFIPSKQVIVEPDQDDVETNLDDSFFIPSKLVLKSNPVDSKFHLAPLDEGKPFTQCIQEENPLDYFSVITNSPHPPYGLHVKLNEENPLDYFSVITNSPHPPYGLHVIKHSSDAVTVT